MTAAVIASAIRSRYLSAIAASTAHDNALFSEPDSGTWVRLKIEGEDAEQRSVGAATRDYRSTGTIIAQVFSDLEAGDRAALDLADSIADAFRGGTTDPVTFEAPVVGAGVRDGRWWRVDVEVPFTADEKVTAATVLPAPDPPAGVVGNAEIASVARQRYEANISVPTGHDNAEFDPPESGLWARMSVMIGEQRQTSMGAILNKYRTRGAIVFQIFSDLEDGDLAAVQLADAIADLYRGVTNSVAAVAPSIVSAEPPDGVVDFSYAHQYQAGGSATITWSLLAGSLPPGLGLDPDTGVLSGTPTTVGTYAFTVRASNAYGTDDQATSVDVTTTAPAPVPLPDSACLKGTGTPQGTVTGLLCQHYIQSDAQNLLWRCISDPSGTDWMLD